MEGWRGTLVVPAESKRMLKRCATDATSASLRGGPSDFILARASRDSPLHNASWSHQGSPTFPQTRRRHPTNHV